MQTIWKIKRCGDDIRLVEDFVSNEPELTKKHICATWAYPQGLFVLTKLGKVWKSDLEKKFTFQMKLDEKLAKLLNPPVKPTTFIKTHFDGLVFIMTRSIILTRLEASSIKSLRQVDLERPVLNLHDFHTSYRFIGWTPGGNILQGHVMDNDIQQNLVWERSEKKQFIAASFLQPDCNHFGTIDRDSICQIHSVQTKDEVWRQKFSMDCSGLVAHPKLPILHVLTKDGRVLVIAVMIKVTFPPAAKNFSGFGDEDEDDVPSDNETFLAAPASEPSIEVTGKLIRVVRVHPNELNFWHFDNAQGACLILGGKEFGKIFLCDTTAGPKALKLEPVPMGKKSSRKKFQPSFDSLARQKSQEIEDTDETPAVVDLAEDVGKYFKVCHWSRFEGKLLDLSFAGKTVVCLVSTPTDEPGGVNETERVQCSGDQVAIFTINKEDNTIQPITVAFLKARCSGICLSDNGRFFFSLLQKRKLLTKFKVPDKDNNSKLAPSSKAETEHQLDLNFIAKMSSKPGYVALCSKDGYISFMSSNLESNPGKKASLT